jgi:hypothetical protein
MSKKKLFVDNVVSNILNDAKQEIKDVQSEIKAHIKILPELQSLIPPLTQEEFEQLKLNLLAEGCREALLVWKNDKEYILIDGHNRYQICKENKLAFRVEVKEFKNIESVKDWMILNQLGKRNLTELQKSYLRGLQYKNEKKKEASIENLKQFSDVDNLTTSEGKGTQRTVEKLSELHKVSPKTIQRDEKFALGLDLLVQDDTDLKNKILSKEVKVPAGVIQKLADAEGKEAKSLKNEIQKQYIETEKETKTKDISKSVGKDYIRKIMAIVKTMPEKELKQLLESLSNKE